MIVESVAQTIIGAHTSSYSHMLDAGLLDSQLKTESIPETMLFLVFVKPSFNRAKKPFFFSSIVHLPIYFCIC